MGTLTCVVASATARDSFVLYVWVDPNADDTTATVNVDSADVGAAAEGSALGYGVLMQGDDGTDRTNVSVDTDGHMQVDVLSTASHAVTNAGTFAVQAASGGDVAHDAADSGNPVKLGAKAISAAPTAVAANDRTDLYADLYGQLRVNSTHINSWVAYHDIAAADAAHADVELKATPGAGLSLFITGYEITNDATAALVITFEEDTASAKTQVGAKKYIPASGGVVSPQFQTAIKLTANKNFGFSNTGQSNAGITIYGYTAA